MQQARMLIGYCPQSNAMLPNLTAREHLHLFATIKGIDEKYRSKLVEQKIKDMGLGKYANEPAGTYSGGNKRKLMVALAMIGNPPIIILDEPSTGMDPEARHDMWDVIRELSKSPDKDSKDSKIKNETSGKVIIFSTHSMEEAEALSKRIAIIVEGELKCIGSKQELKKKFGKGFEIDVKLVDPSK